MTTDTNSTDTAATEQPTQLAQFENSLSELETLVAALERGDISLEQALAKFERGVTLTRQCRSLLKNAELRVDQLLAESDTPQAMDAATQAADSSPD